MESSWLSISPKLGLAVIIEIDNKDGGITRHLAVPKTKELADKIVDSVNSPEISKKYNIYNDASKGKELFNSGINNSLFYDDFTGTNVSEFIDHIYDSLPDNPTTKNDTRKYMEAKALLAFFENDKVSMNYKIK